MKKTFKKISPNPETIRNHKILKKLKLGNPSLWNFNRKSIGKGVAIGLFCAFLPMPMQMILASFLAVIFAGNILISIALVWITNPVTIPPIYYALYKLGAWILGAEVSADFEFSAEFFTQTLSIIWQPVLLGSFIVSTTTAVIGYYTIQLIYLLKIKKRKKYNIRTP
jgi:uncharacterized protein (DUF2062 family)